ncbi:hypothetical protein GOV07_04875 [Candidatus Woesearchaeota archaeon]|nr:hypothetical protein [Candidatus Woesearchaeota archaeon]
MEIVLGVAGLILILGAFAMEEFQKHTRHESLAYNAINFCGAMFLAIYAWSLGSCPFVILNLVWMAIAGYKLVEISKRTGKKRKKRK